MKVIRAVMVARQASIKAMTDVMTRVTRPELVSAASSSALENVAKRPRAACNCSKLPWSTIRPHSIITMKSALPTTARRCVIAKIVVFPRRRCRLSMMLRSVRHRARWLLHPGSTDAAFQAARARAQYAGARRPTACCPNAGRQYRVPAAAAAQTMHQQHPVPPAAWRRPRGAVPHDVLADRTADRTGSWPR